MSTKALLITELTPKIGATQRVANTWAALTHPKGVMQRAVYESLDGDTVLELCALDNLSAATSLDAWRALAWDTLGADLASDFRQL